MMAIPHSSLTRTARIYKLRSHDLYIASLVLGCFQLPPFTPSSLRSALTCLGPHPQSHVPKPEHPIEVANLILVTWLQDVFLEVVLFLQRLETVQLHWRSEAKALNDMTARL